MSPSRVATSPAPQVRKDDPESKANKPRSLTSPVQSKVRKPVIAIAIAVIVVFALLFAWLLQSQSKNQTVFAAKASIARGHIMTVGDLTAVEIPEGQPIPHFLTTDQASVVGKIAQVDIPQGALLAPSNVGTGSGLTAGQSMVGLALTPSQLPPYPLTNGDKVRVVTTREASQTGGATKTKLDPIKATVISTAKDTVSGQTLVAVLVPESDAPTLAQYTAGGKAALILDGAQ